MTQPWANLSDELHIYSLLEQYYLTWKKYGNDPDENMNSDLFIYFLIPCDAILFWQTEL